MSILEATAFQAAHARSCSGLLGPWIERAFYNEARRLDVQFERTYVAGFWTDWRKRHRGKDARIRKYLQRLPADERFFTLIQHSGGLRSTPDNLMVFSAGRAGGLYDIPIPLLVPSLQRDFAPRERPWRISFVGRVTKATNRTGVRSAMLRTFRGHKEFKEHRVCGRSQYCDILRGSEFVLCPRGYGPTSFRLYETLTLGSIPVVIHNDEKWLPYTDVLDWSTFAVVAHARELSSLPERLAAINGVTAQRMRVAARGVFDAYFTIKGLVQRVKHLTSLRD